MWIVKVLKWIFLVVGIGLTGALLFTGLSTGDWLGALGFLAGPILLLFAVPTLFAVDGMAGGGVKKKAYAGAPVGMGTIVGTRHTGLTVNDAPQLSIEFDVESADLGAFRAQAKQLVALNEMTSVSPGQRLPVRYLPDDVAQARQDGRPAKVVLALDASQADLQDALNQIELAYGRVTREQLDVAQRGITMQAVVLAFAPTGEVRDGRAVAMVTLRVNRPDGSQFDVTLEKAPPAGLVHVMQPGQVVTAQYIPGREDMVNIVTSLADAGGRS